MPGRYPRQQGLRLLGARPHPHPRHPARRPPHPLPRQYPGRHVREPGPRGATLVETHENAVRALHFIPTDVLRWAVIPVDATGCDAMPQLAARLRFHLAAARLDAEARPLIARIELTGPTHLHDTLLANPAALDAECRNAALATAPDIHIERVKLRTRPPGVAATDLAALEHAVRAALAEPGLAQSLLKDFERLRSAIPPGAHADIPATEETLAALQDDAWSVNRHALTGAPIEIEA